MMALIKCLYYDDAANVASTSTLPFDDFVYHAENNCGGLKPRLNTIKNQFLSVWIGWPVKVKNVLKFSNPSTPFCSVTG
jgi:hypothetical protein